MKSREGLMILIEKNIVRATGKPVKDISWKKEGLSIQMIYSQTGVF